nr:hypothetical protein CFP56_56961 [Quercus suber]
MVAARPYTTADVKSVLGLEATASPDPQVLAAMNLAPVTQRDAHPRTLASAGRNQLGCTGIQETNLWSTLRALARDHKSNRRHWTLRQCHPTIRPAIGAVDDRIPASDQTTFSRFAFDKLAWR